MRAGRSKGYLSMSKDMAVEGKTLEVFWRPGCPYCASFRRSLGRRGIDATWVNIWQDEQAAWFVRRVNNGDETSRRCESAHRR